MSKRKLGAENVEDGEKKIQNRKKNTQDVQEQENKNNHINKTKKT